MAPDAKPMTQSTTLGGNLGGSIAKDNVAAAVDDYIKFHDTDGGDVEGGDGGGEGGGAWPRRSAAVLLVPLLPATASTARRLPPATGTARRGGTCHGGAAALLCFASFAAARFLCTCSARICLPRSS